MKRLTREWLNAAGDDIITVNELLISELDRLYIDARYPGDLGLMPHGKPTLEEAEMYYQEALKIKEQTEIFLINC